MQKGQLVSSTRSTLTMLMGPLDANHYGYVHGGAIMRAVDEAAFISATRHAKKNVVTAAIDQMSFESPVHLGNLLILKSQVNHVWKTSMEVGVRIETEDPLTGEQSFVGRAYVTMVALDAFGKPAKVPPLALENAEDRARSKKSEARRAFRLKLRKKS